MEKTTPLFGEQQFPILRQRPYLIIYFHLKIIDMLANTFQIGAHCFFIRKGFVFVIIHMVGNLAGFRHFTYLHFDSRYAVGYFAYEFLAVGTEHFILFRWEDFP